MSPLTKHVHALKATYFCPYDDAPTKKSLVFWIRLRDIPQGLSFDPNARDPDILAALSKEIQTTLLERPRDFWVLNRGILLSCRDFEVKNGKDLTFRFQESQDPSETSDGVVDGGHTYLCCLGAAAAAKDALAEASSEDREQLEQRLEETLNSVVKIEGISGLNQEELAAVCEARNTSIPVQQYSLQNSRHLYDPIKEAMDKQFRDICIFYQNDGKLEENPKKFSIKDVLRLLVLFNNELFPYSDEDGIGNKHPVICYTSLGRVMTLYGSAYIPDPTVPSGFAPNSFTNLIPLVNDFMRLYEVVYDAIVEPAIKAAEKTSKGLESHFGIRRLGVARENKKAFPLQEHLFSRKEVNYAVPTAFVLPVLASLRVLINTSAAKPEDRWLVNPFTFFTKHKARIISKLIGVVSKSAGQSHQVGRSDTVWQNCHGAAFAAYEKEVL